MCRGVAVDPFEKYFLTQSTDRSVKVWKNSKSKNKLAFFNSANIRKTLESGGAPPLSEEEPMASYRLFIDENALQSFFRRPDFSPDGNLFLLPASQYNSNKAGSPLELSACALLFRRSQMNSPCLAL